MSPFHAGEIEVQRRRDVRGDAERVGRIIAPEIPPGLAPVLAIQRMVVVASLDGQQRPWASLLTGGPGFLAALDEQLLRLSLPAGLDDTLAANLAVQADLGLLVLDPRTRRRLRFNGRGLLGPGGLGLLVSQVYANCQKYIQRRQIVGESRNPPGPVRSSASLDPRQRVLLASADTFFLATWHPEGGADASHRGGPAGFVEVLDEQRLQFPDYPGNNMLNSLGNIAGHPRAGLLFLDFVSGDVVQLTARAELLGNEEMIVRLEVEEVRETPGAMPLRLEPAARNS